MEADRLAQVGHRDGGGGTRGRNQTERSDQSRSILRRRARRPGIAPNPFLRGLVRAHALAWGCLRAGPRARARARQHVQSRVLAGLRACATARRLAPDTFAMRFAFFDGNGFCGPLDFQVVGLASMEFVGPPPPGLSSVTVTVTDRDGQCRGTGQYGSRPAEHCCFRPSSPISLFSHWNARRHRTQDPLSQMTLENSCQGPAAAAGPQAAERSAQAPGPSHTPGRSAAGDGTLRLGACRAPARAHRHRDREHGRIRRFY